MSTANTIVKRAYNLVGAHSEVNPADPELLNIGLEQLVNLLGEFTADEIDIDATVPTVLGDELSEDSGATTHLEFMLAKRLGPIARSPVPPWVVAGANDGWQKIKNRFQATTIPNMVPSRLLPRGQGSTKGDYARTFFSGEALEDDADSTS